VILVDTNDCIIAATVLEHDCELLHNDRDFNAVAREFPLRVSRVDE
jgi:predicted nucleic acid-binding protein